MTAEEMLLAGIAAGPGDDLAWLALADWLEEDGQPDRAELLRLTRRLRGLAWDDAGRAAVESRICELLAAGVRPGGPEVVNSLGMAFRLIPPGVFQMGEPEGATPSRSDQRPRHEVEITRAFWLGTFQVTQGQFEAVMKSNPSHFKKGRGRKAKEIDPTTLPVECVTWHEAMAFCAALSARPKEKKAKRKYRLPTEAEWEHACRAGVAAPYATGDSITVREANFGGTNVGGHAPAAKSLRRTTPVGSYPPNAFGLHDLHGNVWEWCADWHSETYYPSSPREDPAGPVEGQLRVLRGGSWSTPEVFLRATYRVRNTPTERCNGYGFRVAFTAGGA